MTSCAGQPETAAGVHGPGSARRDSSACNRRCVQDGPGCPPYGQGRRFDSDRSEFSGYGSTWLERAVRDGEIGSSNLPTPIGSRRGWRQSVVQQLWRIHPSTNSQAVRHLCHMQTIGGSIPSSCIHLLAGVAERKTRCPKEAVGESPCRFDSCLPHHQAVVAEWQTHLVQVQAWETTWRFESSRRQISGAWSRA